MLEDFDQQQAYRRNQSHFVFDIETGALDIDALKKIEPVHRAPANLRDPDKIAAAVEQRRKDWFDKAALSPLTGRILAIGIKRVGDTEHTILTGPEQTILEEFWRLRSDNHPATWVGHNIMSFDLPFIARRCWLHGITLPLKFWKGNRFDRDEGVDTMALWSCGQTGCNASKISLDNMARFFGVGAKTGDGAHFANLFDTDRDAAINYLKNDLDLTEAVWLKVGQISNPIGTE